MLVTAVDGAEWTVEREQASKTNPAGMGIHFQYDDDDERTRLQQYVEELIVEHLGPLHAERLLRGGAESASPAR